MVTDKELEACRESLIAFCTRRFGTLDPEDLAQMTIIRAWEKRMYFRRDCKLSSWLHRIAINLGIDEVKKQRYRAAVSLTESDTVPDVIDAGSEADYRAIEDSWVWSCVEFARYSNRESVDAFLSTTAGETYEEAAKRFNVPMGTIRSRVNRGRAICREIAKGVAA